MLRTFLLATLGWIAFGAAAVEAFTVVQPARSKDLPAQPRRITCSARIHPKQHEFGTAARETRSPSSRLHATDMSVISLVAGQENYGLAVVVVAEGIVSLFKQGLSLGNVLRTVAPTILAAAVLVVVSGPMITSGVAGSVSTGLGIASAVSIGLLLSYISRLLTPSSSDDGSKEIAFLGVLIALAGFFSFSQNLVVDGFIQLPQVELPNVFPKNAWEDLDYGQDTSDILSMPTTDSAPMAAGIGGATVTPDTVTDPATLPLLE
jgi:hypothetical protein